MNVKELIEILRKMPPAARILIEDVENHVCADIMSAGTRSVFGKGNTKHYEGAVFLSSTLWIRPSVVLAENRDRIVEILTRFGLTNPRVFGSVARGMDNELSDLDLLVDVPDGTTYFDLCGVAIELKKALGIAVDLQTPGGLNERFRDKVLQEAKPL